MLFELLVYFSQSRKEICICNKDCTHLCPSLYFNASSKTSFHDFIIPHIKDEKEINLYLYSRSKGFSFSVDLPYFHDHKLTIKALIDSKEILLYIKKELNENYTETIIKPGNEIILPGFYQFNNKKIITSANSPSSTTIPVSLGLHQLNHEGTATCVNGPSSTNQVQLSNLSPSTGNSNTGCPDSATGLDQPSAYKCGHRCYGTATYTYTFKGVQFAIHGTKDSTNHYCYVQIDNKQEERVSLYYDGRLDYTIIYTSDILEYGSHTVKIFAKDSTMYEINKFVYWPSITAKRLNCTDFTLSKDGTFKDNKWQTESDGIGGVRKYRNKNGAAIIKLRCTKFWIYGILDKNYPDLQIFYNGKSDTAPTKSSDNSRRENSLIYESPEFEYSSISVNLKPSSGVLIIYCIFYEVPPTPVQTPIPMSVSLQEMNCNNRNNCGSYSQGSNVKYDEKGNFGCTLDFETPQSYQCGIRCWGSNMQISYTFKGVKFGLFGKYDTDFGTIHVNIDGNNIANINANAPTFTYTNLFESDVYVYKDHTVKITSTGLYEIYKLVFWPTLKANRCNSSEFFYYPSTYSHGESDRIGGVRHWFDYNKYEKYYKKDTFGCSKFWIYILSDKNYDNVTITYDDKSFSAIQETPDRRECTLIYESDEFEYKPINLKGTSYGYLVLYCVYYHTEPSEYEYIDKNFHITLPYIQILVTPKSKIKQISGCTFSHISEVLDYFITLEKDVLFFDNTFEYTNNNNEKYAMPINIHYNSQGSNFLTIRNCTFIQAARKTSNVKANVFYCSSDYSINVDFQSCLFDNCGVSSNEIIIQIESQDSFIKMDNCTFQFTQNSCKSISAACSRATINNCKFIKSGPIVIEQKTDDPSSTAELNNIAITRCTFDACSISSYNYECVKILIQTTSSLTFEYNVISNIETIESSDYAIFIHGNNKIDQIEFKNITFRNNRCKSLYGGGSGMLIYDINKLIFTGCDFINNEARKNIQDRNKEMIIPGGFYYNGDGGAFQIGFHCKANKAALIFESCTFKKNKAVRHGGALAIQTLSTVEINNCLFESNEANYNFESSAKLLNENHFNKKTQGRAGAIYINPYYYYEAQVLNCDNIDDYLKKITISNSQFLSNSAYDGYAIYIEGDEVPTEFAINDNTFDGNYNYDEESANNDPNITVRGVIATEIYSVSEAITSLNAFSNVHSRKLIFVDHYGTRVTKEFTFSKEFSESLAFTGTAAFTRTDAFTETTSFTATGDFSQSWKFTKSQMFPDSDVFSKSLAFSNSGKFTETSVFTNTEGFTKTGDFSQSLKFTKSQIFPDSDVFSKSLAFSNSDKFTETSVFTKTEGFTKTDVFSQSLKFTNSKEFSDSSKFSNSFVFSNSEKFTETSVFTKTEGFTKTGGFSRSEKFSNSQIFSDSDKFSHSKEFSKSNAFTKTGEFSMTEGFTETGDFSKSEKFTKSGVFSDSEKFSHSREFSKSNAFTKTGEFSKTEGFTATDDFSKSEKFTKSGVFSDSEKFSHSKEFSKSNAFTKTGEFTKTEGFTETGDFSKSEKFSNSQIFSDSAKFSHSQGFSKSNSFTKTGEFSRTEGFSETGDFSKSEKFTKSGVFSDSEKFSHSKEFSKSNAFTKTGEFTKTESFTETGDFSKSDKFTDSKLFSDSAKFSRSLAFSNSGKFTETGGFTKTLSFTLTGDFTKSGKFSNSGIFSVSQKFSHSQFFTHTGKFSLTDAFTITTQFSHSISFTESGLFSTSLIFSNSGKFTATGPFSSSNKFTATTSFSHSNKFSKSDHFSESFYFSQSQDFSPSIPFVPKAQCALYIDGEYQTINNCEFLQYEGKNIMIHVITSNFTDYQKEGNGGAIHLANCGFLSNQTYFVDCISTSSVGGGGAIFINNSMNIENNITFIENYFLRCKAAYGGAVFLYSISDITVNYFLRCQFLSNVAYAKKSVSNENRNLYGGSSIYASTKSLLVENCSFHHNKNSGVKIINLWNGDAKSKTLLEKSENSIQISGCEFEKDEKSKNSIFYVDESFGNKLEILNCNFKGKLKKGSHYIDGMLHEKESVHVESCNFESDNKDEAINMEIIPESLSLELNSKVLLNPMLNKFWKVIFGALLIITLFSLITLKLNDYSNIDGSDEKALEP